MPQTVRKKIFNEKRARFAAMIALGVSLLAFYSSMFGVIDKHLYEEAIDSGVLEKALMPGVISQDAVTIPLSIVLAFLAAAFLKRGGTRKFITLLGLVWTLLYSYALYAMSGNYTSIYPAYLAIFGASIFCLILGLLSFKSEAVERIALPKPLRMTIAVFFLVIAVMFSALWLSMLVPESLKQERPDAYAVYILDLCMVMPILSIIAVMLIKKLPYGNIFAGVALVKICTLIISVAAGEALVPLYGGVTNNAMIAVYSLVVLFSLGLATAYFKRLKPR